MSYAKWLIIIIDVCLAILGIYFLIKGEKQCVAVCISSLMFDACQAQREVNRNDSISD